MPSKRTGTDFSRAVLSSVLATLVSLGAALLVSGGTEVDVADQLVTVFVFSYPTYAVVYVGWGALTYARLAPDRLRVVASDEHRRENRWQRRLLGMTGTGNTTITAAVVAVMVTIGIAQSPEFRSEHLYLVLGLLTVASAWVLMVYSFAQAYLRLDAGSEAGPVIHFPFSDEPSFGDYLTLAVLMSTMAATVSAELTTRPAWRLARANVLVAFAFNTVIIAMTVSLLFGALAP